MMSKESEQFTPKDIRYLEVAISLALTGHDIQEEGHDNNLGAIMWQKQESPFLLVSSDLC